MNWYLHHYFRMWRRFFSILLLHNIHHLFLYQKTRFPNIFFLVGHWILDLLFILLDLSGAPYLYQWLESELKQNRHLTPQESALVKSIFADSIPNYKIRMDQRAHLGPKQKRFVYVSFFTINSWGKFSAKTLIHEAVHIWQYNYFGSGYIHHAWFAQLPKHGYDYGGPTQLIKDMNNGKMLISYNFEQMACIIADSMAYQGSDHVECYQHFVSQLQNR